MKSIPLRSYRLPYSYHMLWVSLAVSLLILIPVYLMHHHGLVSTLLAIWITVAVIVAAALYESSLLFLLTRFMLKRARDESDNA